MDSPGHGPVLLREQQTPLLGESPEISGTSNDANGNKDAAPVTKSASHDATKTNYISTDRSDSNIPPPDADGRSSTAKWHPYTFGRYFLSVITAYTTLLCLAIVLLYWYSTSHDGLGKDDGSSAVYFGWRFSPSIFAVIYVQLTSMLLEDVKRTEPFARLARSGLKGAAASSTILQAPGAWWNALADGFSTKKNGGRRSWLLVSSALINIVAFLIISPLMPSLLESKNVAVSKQIEFTRLTPKSDGPLSLNAGRDTYLRITGHVLQNISASAWVADNYTMFPFWPADISDAPLGSLLSTTPQTWKAETPVFKAELDCSPLSLSGVAETRENYTETSSQENRTITHTKMVTTDSIILTSDDGCTCGIASGSDVENDGETVSLSEGSVWIDLSRVTNSTWDEGLDARLFSDSSTWNVSKECGDRELIVSHAALNESQLSGYICSTKYYMATVTVTASLSSGSSEIGFDEAEYHAKRVLVPEKFFNTTKLHDQLRTDWSQYLLGEPDIFSLTLPTASDFSGLTLVLAAEYGFNLTAMIDDVDDDVVFLAAQIKQRLFGEMMQYALLEEDASSSEQIPGELIVVERRVVVHSGIAIALIVLFFLSVCLFLVVWRFSRPKHRPMNLIIDPQTTVGIVSLIASQPNTRQGLLHLDQSSQSQMSEILCSKKYYTTPNTLHETPSADDTSSKNEESHEIRESDTPSNSSWRPFVLRMRATLALLLILVAVLVAVLILYNFSERSLLYAKIFTYHTNISVFSTEAPSIAPFSIIPTFIAVVVAAWWAAMDSVFRKLQPYLLMAKGPVSLSRGPGLSYESSSWLYAATKSAFNGHWLLFLLTFGTCLCSVFTVSMSALFYTGPGFVSQQTTIERELELRSVPSLFQADFISPLMFELGSRTQILKNMYKDFDTNWMYSATIQLTLNGSEPAWSSDGWSFLPIDLAKISNSSIHHEGNQTAAEMSSVSTTTSALRGRLECSPYENLDNVSTWLTAYDLTNSSAWNASTFPVDWTIGYQLGVDGNATTPDDPVYNMFNDTYLLWDASRVLCCTNGTNDAERASAFGYWTPYYPDDISLDLKLNPKSYPMNFTTKWIHGHAASGFRENGSETERFLFRDVPSAQALHCAPIIEKASANVVVNEQTGEVQSYSILDEPTGSDDAWRDVYLMHQAASGGAHDILSVTVSYGVLFLDALLGASIHNNMFRLNGGRADTVDEALSDVTFNFRDTDQGLDLDLMTYSMYSMAEKDPKALLNSTIMADLANKTFSTFFQHFVSTNRSETGSWTYQRINDTLPDNLGQILDDDGSVSANQTVSYPVSQSNHTADVLVSTPVEMLRMGRVAVWLSVVVLIWLIVTVVLITVVHRNQLKRLNRNVECAADVLVLVAGSEKLLQLVRDNGIEAVAKGDDRFVAKLGWFEGSDGEVRWGVEVFERDQEKD